MHNIKITSEIKSFSIDSINNTNGTVNWFYLLDENKVTYRCFDENEAKEVIDFLNNVKQNTGFGNTLKDCFTNNNRQDCVNNEFEDEVCRGMNDWKNHKPKPRKTIYKDDFGKNNNGQYKLEFDIIGFIY